MDTEKNDKVWIVLEMDNGWQAVVPDNDSEAHAKYIFIAGEEKDGILSGMDCPCRPQVDFKDKIIIHNAFDGRE